MDRPPASLPRVAPSLLARNLTSIPPRRSTSAPAGGGTPETFAQVLARTSAPGGGTLPASLRPTAAPAPLLRPAAQPLRPPATSPASPVPAADGTPYAATIESAARSAGIDPALLAAVAQVESGFNPRAQSYAGAKGLMQLMDSTARGLGVTDPFDPTQSLNGGARFLGSLLRQFNGDVSKTLAAYNAGPGAVQRFGGIPPYEETRRYVPKVLGVYDQIRRRWSAASAQDGVI